MDFSLSEELVLLRKAVRRFAEQEILPFAERWDREERFPRDLIRKMGELGFFASPFPKEYGGTELGFLANAIVGEELARASLGVAGCFNMQTGTCPLAILRWGTEEQKRRFLPALIGGEALGAFALTEPDIGSDVAGIRTTAVRDGDSYVLNGSKTWITHATCFDVAVVFAKTDPGKRHEGLSAFLVEGTQRGKGLMARKIENKLYLRSSDTGELSFEDCRVPKANLIGREGEGFRIAMDALSYGRVNIAARALGLAQASLEAAVKYANEREQFGRKIGEFQMIKQLLADMATEVEAARLLVYKAAWLQDQGRPAGLVSSMAKLLASEVCLRAAEAAARIHGAYSCSPEFPVGRYYRDALLTVTGEGTSNIQRILIANDVLGWKKLP